MRLQQRQLQLMHKDEVFCITVTDITSTNVTGVATTFSDDIGGTLTYPDVPAY